MRIRCEKLESYGFIINQEDSDVSILLPDDSTIDGIDFSAISSDMFLKFAFQKVLDIGRKRGIKQIQNQIRTSLGIVDIQEEHDND